VTDSYSRHNTVTDTLVDIANHYGREGELSFNVSVEDEERDSETLKSCAEYGRALGLTVVVDKLVVVDVDSGRVTDETEFHVHVKGSGPALALFLINLEQEVEK